MKSCRLTRRKNLLTLLAPGAVLLMLMLAMAGTSGTVSAMSWRQYERSVACPNSGTITCQSLLVVLLDRSGSLIFQPGATDPDGYSTSVTRALADLWPGRMAVIPFSNDQTPVLGPVALSDPAQRENLKSAIQNYPIGGATPLAPALHQALDVLNGASPGSRVVIVTDGSPDPAVMNGMNQADDIRSHLIPQFRARDIPISTFGLALDLTQPDGRTADQLLKDIATGTGGVYTYVRNSEDLAQVVIKLYADWQHLVFVQVPAAGNAYIVHIDTYAKKVAFVTFHAESASRIVLDGPGGQAIPDQVLERSTDRHYEIDSLVLSDINQPGAYTVNAGGGASTQVYALVESRLHVVLVKPTAQTKAYIGQPLQIEAELFNDATPIVPQPNEATIVAHVTTLVKGQLVSSSDVELVQGKNSPLFARQITLSGPAGQVRVELSAVYRQVPVEASDAHVTIPLLMPVATGVQHPSVPSCGLNARCYWQRFSTLILVASPLVLLVLLLLFWLFARGPRGSLQQGRHSEDLARMRRPLLRRLLHKSVLSAQELEVYGDFQFGGASFDLLFGRGVDIRAKSETPVIKVKKGKDVEVVRQENRNGVELNGGDAILVGASAPAVYLEEEHLDDEKGI